MFKRKNWSEIKSRLGKFYRLESRRKDKFIQQNDIVTPFESLIVRLQTMYKYVKGRTVEKCHFFSNRSLNHFVQSRAYSYESK